MIPTGTHLGELEIDTEYDYYDGPMLAIVGDGKGKKYLAIWNGETKNSRWFLYTRVTDERIAVLESSEMTIYQAYAQSEYPLYQVFVSSHACIKDSVKTVEQISDDLMPTKGFFVRRPR